VYDIILWQIPSKAAGFSQCTYSVHSAIYVVADVQWRRHLCCVYGCRWAGALL